MPGSDAHAASASAYDAIVAALAATARGRAFLAEHARRTRSEETRTLLAAIARLESRLEPRDHHAIRVQTDAVAAGMRDVETHLRTGTPTAHHEPGGGPRDLADAAQQTATAIGDGVEAIQDIAWMMREAGFDAELCDRLDRHAEVLGRAGSDSHALASALASLARAAGIAAMETARLAQLVGNGTPPAYPGGPEGLLATGLAEDLEFPLRPERADERPAARSVPSDE